MANVKIDGFPLDVSKALSLTHTFTTLLTDALLSSVFPLGGWLAASHNLGGSGASHSLLIPMRSLPHPAISMFHSTEMQELILPPKSQVLYCGNCTCPPEFCAWMGAKAGVVAPECKVCALP